MAQPMPDHWTPRDFGRAAGVDESATPAHDYDREGSRTITVARLHVWITDEAVWHWSQRRCWALGFTFRSSYGQIDLRLDLIRYALHATIR
jgi:hypothetical protein